MKLRGAGRCGERTERCRWQRKRSERVAAVKILSDSRKAAQKFWAPQQGHRPLRKRNKNCGEAGRRGRRPLRSSIGEWCVGVGLPDDPNRAYTAPLVKPHVIAKPVTEVTGCGNPHSRPLRRGITDSHDQSADGSRNDTQTFLNFPTAFPLFFRLFLLYSRKRRRFA